LTGLSRFARRRNVDTDQAGEFGQTLPVAAWASRELCGTIIIDIHSHRVAARLTVWLEATRHARHQRSRTMSILISILITFLVIILVLYLINYLPLDGRAKQIVQAIVIIIGILSLLRYLAVF